MFYVLLDVGRTCRVCVRVNTNTVFVGLSLSVWFVAGKGAAYRIAFLFW